MCAQDVKHCGDNSFVSRDPKNNCQFPPCRNLICAEDVMYCSETKFVKRDPQNNCNFPSCDDDKRALLGGNDEFGCAKGGGFSWCESKQKCLRIWEEDCPVLGSDVDQYGCKSSAGESWCSSKQKCIRNWEESCPDNDQFSIPPGGDVDSHGCKPSAGYTWCASLQVCLRVWEEDCPDSRPGSDVDQNGCKSSAGETWCESKKACLRAWEEECPDVLLPPTLLFQQQPLACSDDMKDCGDGTFVSRNPQKNCEFHACGQQIISEGADTYGQQILAEGDDIVVDQFSCKVSDGYSWCASKTKCIPTGEDCPAFIEVCSTTQDCPIGKYCICNPSLQRRLGWQMHILGNCVPWQQDGEVCTDYDGYGCEHQCAPDLICYKNPLLANSPGVCGKSSDEVFFCLDEVKRCPDGSFVGRDPDNECEFFPCEYVFIGCTEESKQCSDGTFVYRTPERGCDFTPCNYALSCTRDVQMCLDGTHVYRNPRMNCEFDICPYAPYGEQIPRNLMPNVNLQPFNFVPHLANAHLGRVNGLQSFFRGPPHSNSP